MKIRYSPLILLCTAVLSVVLKNQNEIAIASTSTTAQYCIVGSRIDDIFSPFKTKLFSPDNSNRVNIRKKPSTRSTILHVASSDKFVTVYKQVAGNDGYCWFQVKPDKSKITGWIRGDLLDIPID